MLFFLGGHMEFEIKRGQYNYLLAEKNLEIEDVIEYLKKEEMEAIFEVEMFKKIRKENVFSILSSVYVHPDEREQGFATDMMYEYLKKVKANVYILLADVSNDSDEFSIEKFYNKFGFKTIYQDEIFPIMVKFK